MVLTKDILVLSSGFPPPPSTSSYDLPSRTVLQRSLLLWRLNLKASGKGGGEGNTAVKDLFCFGIEVAVERGGKGR